MMIVIPFHVDPYTDFGLARNLVRDAVITSKYVYLEKDVTVVTEEVQLSNLGICLRMAAKAYVFDCRYEKAFVTDVTERVHRAFRAHGIVTPGRMVPEPAAPALAITAEEAVA
jgi:hypothetical protein